MTACVNGIRIGRPVNPSKKQEEQGYRLLFDAASTDEKSHVFETLEGGFLVQAFGLQPDTELVVYMVAGLGQADYEEQLLIDGKAVKLTHLNNVAFLPFPFRYRLLKVGPQALGTFIAYAVPVPFEQVNAVAAAKVGWLS